MDNESTEKSAIPASPQLVTPREAAIVNGHEVTFEWRAVDEADAYRLEVARDTSFESVVFEKEVPGDATTLTVADFFPVSEETFFWRVLAKNDEGWSRGERVESFVSGTPDEATQQIDVPDQEEEMGPVTELVRSASQTVADKMSTKSAAEKRFEKERERGVAYEGVPSGQILAIAVSILVAVTVLVIILFQWTNITEAAVREATVDPSDYTALRETRLEANRKLTQYEVINEEEGRYRIPIERAMESMANEAYQQEDRTYSSDAPFVQQSP